MSYSILTIHSGVNATHIHPLLRSAAVKRLLPMENDVSLLELKAVAQCPIKEAVPKVLQLVVDPILGRPSTKLIQWLVQHQWLRKLWKAYPVGGEQKDLDDFTRLILYLVVHGKDPIDPYINTSQFEPLVTRVKMSKGTPLVFRFLTLIHRETYVYDNISEWIGAIETESPDYVEELLLLLSVGNSSRHLMLLIKRTRVVARCRALHFKQSIYFLTEVLLYYLNIRSGVSEFEQFELLQLIVHLNFGERYAEFIVIASPQIWGHDNLRKFIESLTIQEKQTIIKDIERGGDCSMAPKLTESVMNEVIYAFVCIPFVSESLTVEPTRATELELFDRFGDPRLEEKINFILPFETAPLDETDYMIRTRVSLWQQSCFDLSRHLEAVLSRFFAFGASKYMFPVTHINKIVSEEYEIETPAPLRGKLFFLLLEVGPPDPHEELRRLRDWGLSLVRLCKVEPSDSRNVVFSCKNSDQVSGFERRVNWVVVMPPDLIGPDQIKFLETKEFAIPLVHEAEDVVESSIFANPQENNNLEPNVKRVKTGGIETLGTPHLQTEGVFQSIVHNKFTLVHEMLRFNTLDMIIERVLSEDLKHRTLVLTLSQQHVNSFSHNSRWIRYGSEQDLADWRDDLKKYRDLLKSRGLIGVPLVDVAAQWEAYVEKYSPKAPVAGLKRGASPEVTPEKEVVQHYPFSKDLSSFKEVVADYQVLFDAYVLIDLLKPLEHIKVDPWEYLFNQRNVIMSIDDYVRLLNDINDASYLSNRRLRGFDHVIVVNGLFFATPIACPAHEIQVTIIGGSQSDTVPICDISLDDSLVRPEFIVNPNVPMIPISRAFNPGFVETASVISCSGQIENAEYCVLLFQYMRLLKYPAHRITILVSTPRHQAIVKEILHNLCGEKVARDGDDFQYGWPAGVELNGDNRVRVNDYAIISLFDELNEDMEKAVEFSDPNVAKLMYMGRFGNYIVSPVGSSLMIQPGETFESVERKDVETNLIASKADMQSYIAELYKLVTNLG